MIVDIPHDHVYAIDAMKILTGIFIITLAVSYVKFINPKFLKNTKININKIGPAYLATCFACLILTMVPAINIGTLTHNTYTNFIKSEQQTVHLDKILKEQYNITRDDSINNETDRYRITYYKDKNGKILKNCNLNYSWIDNHNKILVALVDCRDAATNELVFRNKP